MAERVTVRRAAPGEEPVLRHLLEQYADELSAIFHVERGPDGRIVYETLPLYWTEPEERLDIRTTGASSSFGAVRLRRAAPRFDFGATAALRSASPSAAMITGAQVFPYSKNADDRSRLSPLSSRSR